MTDKFEPLDIIEIGKNNPRLARLVVGNLPRPKTLECVLCHQSYKKGSEDYDFVHEFGFCLSCDDIRNDIAMDRMREADDDEWNEVGY